MAGSATVLRKFSKIFSGFIYLSFFLVQFNVHLNGLPGDVSYFSSDYSSVNSTHYMGSLSRPGLRKDVKLRGFKLNKRFQPESLVTAPVLPGIFIHIIYSAPVPLLNEDEPLTQYSFNSPSLRGPPAVV
jgi:hypothetical protein